MYLSDRQILPLNKVCEFRRWLINKILWMLVYECSLKTVNMSVGELLSLSHTVSLSAWVHGLANGQRGAGLLVMRINSDSAQLYLCLVVCVFVGWFSGSSFCVSPFCDRNKVKIKLKMADPLLLKMADPLLLKMAAPLYLKMADSLLLGGFHWALHTWHRVMKYKPVYCGCWSPWHMKMVISAAI